ncbi:hypothetical protein ACFL2V_17990 [Pseudomonadota bacterium]
MQKILGHTDIKTTLRYTRLTSHTQDNTAQAIEQLMNSFSIQWGGVK